MAKRQAKTGQSRNVEAGSISSRKRMEAMLSETEKELGDLQPKIEKLEKQVEKLNELKQTKQKLITLRLSLKSILSNFETGKTATSVDNESDASKLSLKAQVSVSKTSEDASDNFIGTFLPDAAFQEAGKILKKKGSINYELYRAVVFSGGRATTGQIRDYLVENGITRPGSGESFDNAPLTEISSRINYLVRRGVVVPSNRGEFVSIFGWEPTSGV